MRRLNLTFVAVAHSVEVNVVVVVAEEHETEPRVERVDWNDEEDSNDPALFVRTRVVAQVHEYLTSHKYKTLYNSYENLKFRMYTPGDT